jgi:catechol 2,3-dioxygenase-like lactoylglutathione lyase family enzyme
MYRTCGALEPWQGLPACYLVTAARELRQLGGESRKSTDPLAVRQAKGALPMDVRSLDHIVLIVSDLDRTRDFYQSALGMVAREEKSGKWSLHFGVSKISLQDAARPLPEIASGSLPGSGNFCLLTDFPMGEVVAHLRNLGIAILEGPAMRDGATGPLLSIYIHDPDGNLIEVSNPA